MTDPLSKAIAKQGLHDAKWSGTVDGDHITETAKNKILGDMGSVTFKKPPDDDIAASMPSGTDTPKLNHGPVQQPLPLPGGGGDPAQGGIAANTDAMMTYAKNLMDLVYSDDGKTPLQQAKESLHGVTIRPGGFRGAIALKEGITGGDKLIPATLDSIGVAIEAIHRVAQAVHKVGVDLASNEERNKMSAKDAGKYLGQAAGYIKNVAKIDGGTGAKPSGGGSDSGSSDSAS
jgi:hypothetical protein